MLTIINIAQRITFTIPRCFLLCGASDVEPDVVPDDALFCTTTSRTVAMNAIMTRAGSRMIPCCVSLALNDISIPSPQHFLTATQLSAPAWPYLQTSSNIFRKWKRTSSWSAAESVWNQSMDFNMCCMRSIFSVMW